jgi:hypothetical protein
MMLLTKHRKIEVKIDLSQGDIGKQVFGRRELNYLTWAGMSKDF